jgi:hypothetical protein
MIPKYPKLPPAPKLPNANTRGSFMMPDTRMGPVQNPQAYEHLIETQGSEFILSRAMPCPKVQDERGETHPPVCECIGGFVFYGHQKFIGAMLGNSNSRQYTPQGTVDYDTASFLVPTHDSAGNPLEVTFMDRIENVNVEPIRFYQRVDLPGSESCRLLMSFHKALTGQGPFSSTDCQRALTSILLIASQSNWSSQAFIW